MTVVGSGHADIAATWVPTRLPYLCDGCGGQARAVNDRGQIVGLAAVTKPGPEGGADYHAVLWQGRRIRDLGTLGGSVSLAQDINDRGQVVGWSYVRDRVQRAVLWEAGRIRNLGALPGRFPQSSERDSEAYALNERGQIVGSSSVWRAGKWYSRAVLWESGRMLDLGTLPGHESSGATGINERGEIVGWSARQTDLIGRSLQAVVWRDGRIHDLGIRTDYGGAAINDRGRIVTSSGWLWNRGRKTNLCLRTGGRCTAQSIDNLGRVVGSQDDETSQLFDQGTIWQGPGAYPFRTHLLYDIANNGVIVSSDVEGHGFPSHAYVWRIRR